MGIGKSSQDLNQSGSSDTSFNQVGQVRPVVTPNWNDASNAAYGLLGTTGLSPAQQKASDSWSDYLANPNNGVSQMIDYNKQYLPFTTPQVNTAANAPTINASTAYSMADPYRQAYGTGVLDTALADYDTGVARAGNAYRANSISGGSTGGAYGSSPVGAGVLAGEAARGRGALSSQIRSDILDKSFGLGGSDAGMKLNADVTNAANILNNNQFNARQGDVANQIAMQAIQSMINNAGTEQQLGGQANIIQSQLGGTGLDNFLRYMGGQTPAFGTNTANQGTSHTDSTSSGSGTGKNGSIG